MAGSPEAGGSVSLTPRLSTESTPTQCNSEKPRQHLSASLKARLQRSRRSFATPSSVAKRLCVDDDDDDDGEEGEKRLKSDGRQVAADPKDVAPEPPGDDHNVDRNENQVQSRTTDGVSEADALTLRDRLRGALREKTETLRRLNMVKMYRSKNNLTHLQTLIDKWRGCSQAALYQLQTDLPVDGQKASLAQLIDLFGLEDKILHFDRLEDDFTD